MVYGWFRGPNFGPETFKNHRLGDARAEAGLVRLPISDFHGGDMEFHGPGRALRFGANGGGVGKGLAKEGIDEVSKTPGFSEVVGIFRKAVIFGKDTIGQQVRIHRVDEFGNIVTLAGDRSVFGGGKNGRLLSEICAEVEVNIEGPVVRMA